MKQEDFDEKRMPRSQAQRKREKRIVIVSSIIIVVACVAAAVYWIVSVSRLRAEMESSFSRAVQHIEDGRFGVARTDALEALSLAEQLRDDGYINRIINHIQLIETVMRGDEQFGDGDYHSARNTYQLAAEYSLVVDSLSLSYINDMIAKSDGFYNFFTLLGRADHSFEQDDLDTALSLYEEATQAAAALSYAGGEELAQAGIKNTKERIVLIKRYQAESYLVLGDQNLLIWDFEGSLAFYRYALEIYQELNDQSGAAEAETRIDDALQRQAEKEQEGAEGSGDGSPDEPEDGSEAGSGEDLPGTTPGQGDGEMNPETNYEFNRSLNFDLSALIDDQNQSPASQVRMGTDSNRNEGWYNGCGWVATYNALVLLGDAKHPAEIVRDFEVRGTVMGGVYGTYPNAIERFLRDAGFNANLILFPQAIVDIDNAIRAAGIGILGYAHTTAAHYATIVYHEEDDTFIVYNDGFARSRAMQLGTQNESGVGAVIDSVLQLIEDTQEILISFSLITVKP